MSNHYKTIVISDLRLGSEVAKARHLARFLKYNTCDKLILNGDILDSSCFSNKNYNKRYLRFFATQLSLIHEYGTEIYYIKGKSDPLDKRSTPLLLSKVKVVDELELNSAGKRFLVMHGDIADLLNSWLFRFKDLGRGKFLSRLNKFLNKRNLKDSLWFFLRPESIAFRIEESSIEKIEERLARYVESMGYDGLICGYTNKPSIKSIGKVQYMNCGDWIFSLSALAEEYSGEWSLVFYNETRSIRHSKAV